MASRNIKDTVLAAERKKKPDDDDDLKKDFVNALIGAGQGATLDFGDELYGVGGGMQSLMYGVDPIEGYKATRDEARARIKKAETESPNAYMAGNLAGSVAVPVPGLGTARAGLKAARPLAKVIAETSVKDFAKQAMQRIGTSMGLGGVKAAGKSEADNLKDFAADVATGAVESADTMPGPAMATDQGTMKWHPNSIGKPGKKEKINMPNRGEEKIRRPVKFKDEELEHVIFKMGHGTYDHLLLKDGEPIARISGTKATYEDQDENHHTGFAIGRSGVGEGGKGYGKKLYELVLDTHGQVFSDDSLSPAGSAKIYQKHFPSVPGVNVTDAKKHTDERFIVNVDDVKKFRKSVGARKLTKAQRKKAELDDYDDDEFLSANNNRRDDYDDDPDYDDVPSLEERRRRQEKEAQERLNSEARSSLIDRIQAYRNRALDKDIRGVDLDSSSDLIRQRAAIEADPKWEHIGSGYRDTAFDPADKRSVMFNLQNQASGRRPVPADHPDKEANIERIRSMLRSPNDHYRDFARNALNTEENPNVVRHFDPARSADMQREQNLEILRGQMRDSKRNFRRREMARRLLVSEMTAENHPELKETRKYQESQRQRQRGYVERDAKEYGKQLPKDWDRPKSLSEYVGSLEHGAPGLNEARSIFTALTGGDPGLRKEAQAIMSSVSEVRRQQLENIMRPWREDREDRIRQTMKRQRAKDDIDF